MIDSSKEKLLQKFTDFRDSPPSVDELHTKFNVAKKQGWDILKGWQNLQGESNLEKYIQKIAYRPFDMRYIFYEDKLVWRCVKDIMRHFSNNENLGLNVARQSKIQGSWQYATITDSLVDFSLMGGGNTGNGYIFPLYLKTDSESKSNAKSPLPCGGGLGVGKNPQDKTKLAKDSMYSYPPPVSPSAREGDSWVENFTPQFRAFIDAKYGESYAPEVILGYIYAILYHKDYREKYVDFLKIDFPKIPFVQSKKDFLALSALDGELIDLHLMRVDLSGESVGKPLFNDTANKNERIDKIAYNAESKRLFVNSSLYFDNVSAEVWEYKIGGYAVLDKYLKSHKGESIDYTHFERVIKTLHKSLQIEAKIAQIELG